MGVARPIGVEAVLDGMWWVNWGGLLLPWVPQSKPAWPHSFSDLRDATGISMRCECSFGVGQATKMQEKSSKCLGSMAIEKGPM